MSQVGKRLARAVAPHWVYRIYRRRKIAQQLASYEPREVVHSFGGHALRVHLADPVAEGWYDHDWKELGEISFLRRQGALRSGARVFDLGAHQGIVALVLARVVGPEGSVVAVEAEPHNAAVAAINRRLNDATNLDVVHAAVADSSGTRWFAEGLNGNVDDRTTRGNVQVTSLTIDDLAKRYGRPDLVVIDVEGYEGRVLQGAAETLRRGATSFLVEVHESLVGFRSEDIADVFAEYQVSVSAIDASGACELRPLSEGLPQGRFYLVAIPASMHAGKDGLT